MKNFLLTDLSELMAVTLISPPDRKNVWFLLSRHDVRRVHENLLLADSSEVLAVRLILASWDVEFLKNFSLADSSELMAIRLISASWAQKRLIPTF